VGFIATRTVIWLEIQYEWGLNNNIEAIIIIIKFSRCRPKQALGDPEG
jgi:hypothetical protein